MRAFSRPVAAEESSEKRWACDEAVVVRKTYQLVVPVFSFSSHCFYTLLTSVGNQSTIPKGTVRAARSLSRSLSVLRGT